MAGLYLDPIEMGLVRACREAPKDDAPALVYADYLDENGRTALATTIRRSCNKNMAWRKVLKQTKNEIPEADSFFLTDVWVSGGCYGFVCASIKDWEFIVSSPILSLASCLVYCLRDLRLQEIETDLTSFWRPDRLQFCNRKGTVIDFDGDCPIREHSGWPGSIVRLAENCLGLDGVYRGPV
jgi:uncharacterized protein (TIGR02996 family)